MAKKKAAPPETPKIDLCDWRGHTVTVEQGSSVEARLRARGYSETATPAAVAVDEPLDQEPEPEDCTSSMPEDE